MLQSIGGHARKFRACSGLRKYGHARWHRFYHYQQQQQNEKQQRNDYRVMQHFLLALPLAVSAVHLLTSYAENEFNNNSSSNSTSSAQRIYRKEEIAKHNSIDKRVWVTYKDGVYDITKFIPNHPGGREKILMAAGDSIEPYWNLYQQHYNSSLPMELLQSMRVGTLHPDDFKAVEESQLSEDDPYVHDPKLAPVMIYFGRKPINAEPPGFLLADAWITPSSLWFVRNHHPIPHLDASHYALDLETQTTKHSQNIGTMTLDDLKTRFTPRTIVATLQCGGNRRAEMSALSKTNGSSWSVSAISTAEWKGALLRDVLLASGITEELAESSGLSHVQFLSADGLEASIPIRKALSRHGDVLLAYEMNGEALPAKHGFPVRVVVPGHVGVRNVKWVTKVQLSFEEAHGPWQRGMSYKGFGPSTTSLEDIDVEAIPSLQEQPVQSAITYPPPNTEIVADGPAALTVKGYAYSGGGRGIVRVDVSIDGGKTWKTATLDPNAGAQQPLDRAWAWTFWECDFDVPEQQAGSTLQVVCKATDASYNVQPDSVEGVWNLRGINNNAWHRVQLAAVSAPAEEEEEGESVVNN